MSRRKLPPIDTESLWVVLVLVGIEVDQATLDTWTPEDRALAEVWAVKTHLRASDNPVQIPDKPSILAGYAV